MAIPQFAMAALPLSLATLRNVLSASSYQNECSSATPRLKSASTLGEHEVWKCTVPSSSTVMEWWWPSSAGGSGDRRNKGKRSAAAIEFIGFPEKIELPSDFNYGLILIVVVGSKFNAVWTRFQMCVHSVL